MEANFYVQNHSVINGRNIYLYLISCPIGDIYFVQYEQKDMSLNDIYVGRSNQKAEMKYEEISVKMVKGVL